MIESGERNPANGAETFGLSGAAELRWNWSEARLFEAAVAAGEAEVSAHGCLSAVTGRHTGRAAKDRFIVRDAATENEIWWDAVRSLTPDNFAAIKSDMLKHAQGRTLYVQDLYGGADPTHRVKVRVFCEYAWHALFIRYMLRRPETAELASFEPDLTIIDLPSFAADPARHGCRTETVIACDFTERRCAHRRHVAMRAR